MRFTDILQILMLASSVRGIAADFVDKAIKLMEESPLLDTHIDLPQIIRSLRTGVWHPLVWAIF